MSGFVSHLHIIKSKLLVIEELVERRVFFSRLLLHAWVWKEPGSRFSWHAPRWGPGCGERGRGGCVRARGGTLDAVWSCWWKPWCCPSVCWAGRCVCVTKLHPGAGSWALLVPHCGIQGCPKQAFPWEMGKETAGKTSLWIFFFFKPILSRAHMSHCGSYPLQQRYECYEVGCIWLRRNEIMFSWGFLWGPSSSESTLLNFFELRVGGDFFSFDTPWVLITHKPSSLFGRF